MNNNQTSAVNNTANKTFTTKYMVELAAMIAIIIIMAFTPLGYIKLPGLTITFLTIPVAVGAIILGMLVDLYVVLLSDLQASIRQ